MWRTVAAAADASRRKMYEAESLINLRQLNFDSVNLAHDGGDGDGDGGGSIHAYMRAAHSPKHADHVAAVIK